jgi:hypothetical protein
MGNIKYISNNYNHNHWNPMLWKTDIVQNLDLPSLEILRKIQISEHFRLKHAPKTKIINS